MAANIATNGGTGTWTRQSGTGTITDINDPTTTITGLGYGSSVFRWRITSALGICAATQDNVTLTRNQNPDDKTIAPASTPICYNSSTNINIPASQVGIRYDLYRSVGPVLVGSVNGTGGLVSVSTGALTANTNFYVVAVNTATTCNRTLNTVTVNVDPATVAGSVTGGSTVCQGSTSAELTLSGYTGSIVRWEYRYDNGGGYGSWTAIANTNNTYTSFALSPVRYQFRAVVQSGVCAALNSGATTVNVSPTTVGGTVNGSGGVCQGSTSGLLSLIGQTGAVLNWEYRYDNGGGFGGWNNIANTGTTYTSGALSAGVYEFRAVVQSGACLVAYSNPASITVEPTLNPGSISGNQDICWGDTPIAFVSVTPASGGSAPTYLWYHKLNAGAWASLPGETNATYTAPNTLVIGTHYYYRQAISSTGYCGPEQTNEVNIVVNPGPTSTGKLAY